MSYEDPLYGSVALPATVTNLLQTASIQRLRGIHQGGAIVLANPAINYTRFAHSVGVLLLIRHLGEAYANSWQACCTMCRTRRSRT
jgi:HD superfamily phosphohydrolase